jgi:hypothetical protein
MLVSCASADGVDAITVANGFLEPGFFQSDAGTAATLDFHRRSNLLIIPTISHVPSSD